MTIYKFGKMLLAGGLLASTFFVVSASAESKARIVRLSDVEGTVQMDRGTGDGLEKAFLNLPVIEGSHLKTGKDGRAEIEFEDGSALRLGPDSELAFTRLALGDDGQKFSTVQLLSGTAYGNLREKRDDQFQLNFAKESITVPAAAHFRVVLEDANATVAVFKGRVDASGPSGQAEVAEKHSATIDLASTDGSNKDAIVLAKNYDQDPLDGWDRQQNDYHDRYATTKGSSFNSPYGYGVSDLNYYGNFMNVPGYGYAWQPFLMDASWSPFMDGAWSYYPGAGYMWVSGYPWGWMPYRYGNWAFVPGYGWIWQPGYWNTYYAIPRVVNPPARWKAAMPPTTGHSTVLVGRGLTSNPPITARRMTITPGSAGFGVPRGSVRHLDHVAKTVERTSAPVVIAPQPPAQTSNTGFGTRPTFNNGGNNRGDGGGRSAAPTAAPPVRSSPPHSTPHK
jgi:hypothetical protein